METKIAPATNTGNSQNSSGMLRRSELVTMASAVSKSWTGQGQISFASLVTDWESRFPDQARRLVYDIFGYRERISGLLVCSEDTRIGVFAALKKAKTAAQASGALNTLMSTNGDTLLRRLDDANHIPTGSTFPKYAFDAKVRLLAAELQLE